MDEKQPSSSWDDLLKEIGAEPTADAFERKRKAIETPMEPTVERPAPSQRQRPSDWGALHNALGIQSDEPPADPPKPSSRRQPAASAPTPVPASRDIEAGFASIAPLESQFEEIIEEELTDVEFAEQDDSDILDEGIIETRDDPDGLSGDAARSAFEALFSPGSFSSPPSFDPQPRRRPPRENVRRAFDDPPRSLDVEPSESRRGSDEPEDRGDRSRRRRRRRGRGRGGESRSPRGDEARGTDQEGDENRWSGDADEVDAGRERERTSERDRDGETEERPERRRRSRRGRGGSAADDSSERQRVESPASKSATFRDDDSEDADDLAAELGGLDDADDGGSIPSSHKGIPSWQDAIGIMVETNMQSRKNSPQRTSGSRERERGRGRGRGGRGGRRKP